jgi:hypothetical protein
MHIWTNENGDDVYRGPRPAVAFPPLLHQQIDALGIGVAYRIEWPNLAEKTASEEQNWPGIEIIRIFIEGQLDAVVEDSVALVVDEHDGADAIREDEAKRQRMAEILAQNEATIEAARAKRLAGEALTAQELAAVADLFMFQGF